MSRKNVKNQLHSHIGSCEVANTICTTASQHPRSSGADEVCFVWISILFFFLKIIQSAIDIIDYAFDKFEATMLWEELNNEEIPGGVNVRYSDFYTAFCRQFLINWLIVSAFSCTSLPFSESSSLAKRTTESSPPAKKSGISFSSPEGPKAPPPTPDVISDNQSQDERTQKEVAQKHPFFKK